MLLMQQTHSLLLGRKMFSSLRSFYFAALDQEGIKLFAFHGKINEEMNGREGGTIFQRHPQSQKWPMDVLRPLTPD
jgi:hypothetical protein